MLAIDLRWRGQISTVYAKAELYNPTGSIRDRMACSIVGAAYERGSSFRVVTPGSISVGFPRGGGFLGAIAMPQEYAG